MWLTDRVRAMRFSVVPPRARPRRPWRSSRATETFILHDEYYQIPHVKGLGDAAALSAALSRAIDEQHPWHYYPVTEERLAIWKRVMDRIIKHKPELAAVVGPWYTGLRFPRPRMRFRRHRPKPGLRRRSPPQADHQLRQRPPKWLVRKRHEPAVRSPRNDRDRRSSSPIASTRTPQTGCWASRMQPSSRGSCSRAVWERLPHWWMKNCRSR